jgi:uncharacterized protein YjbI with pentapeptide repeats
LQEADLVQPVDGEGAVISLADADLVDTNLGDAEVGIDLSGANLFEANLSKADLRHVDLSSTTMYGTDLSGANLFYATMYGANLTRADLHEANLTEAFLSGATLTEANLSAANLKNAFLREADLFGTNLSGALLTEALLKGTNLSGANLSGADLREAVLLEADLSGSYLNHVYLNDVKGLTKEQLEQATNLEGATMPDGAINAGRFEPGLSLNVSDGWRLAQPVMTNKLLIKGPDGGCLIFRASPQHVFDPSNPNEREEVPAPENADEWVSWFQKHPNLDTSEPVRVSVGGASGVRVDVAATSAPENYPRDYCGAQPCVPLFPENVSYSERKSRYVIVDVGGEPVVIDIDAPADKFDEFLPKAQKVLDTVEWRERA